MSSRFTLIYILILSGIVSCNPAKSGKLPMEVSEEILDQAKSKTDFQSTRNAVQKVLADQAKAWNEGNIDGFMQGYWHSDSLKFITKNGIRMGYDSVAINYKKSYDTKDKLGRLNFNNLSISPLDLRHTIVQVTGKWEVIQKDKTLSGIFSLLFRQIDGQWKIIVDHTW